MSRKCLHGKNIFDDETCYECDLDSMAHQYNIELKAKDSGISAQTELRLSAESKLTEQIKYQHELETKILVLENHHDDCVDAERAALQAKVKELEFEKESWIDQCRTHEETSAKVNKRIESLMEVLKPFANWNFPEESYTPHTLISLIRNSKEALDQSTTQGEKKKE